MDELLRSIAKASLLIDGEDEFGKFSFGIDFDGVFIPISPKKYARITTGKETDPPTPEIWSGKPLDKFFEAGGGELGDYMAEVAKERDRIMLKQEANQNER